MYVAVETMRSFTYQTLARAAQMEVGGGGRGELHMQTAASVMYAAQAVEAYNQFKNPPGEAGT